MRFFNLSLIVLLIFGAFTSLFSQSKWKRDKEEQVVPKLELFASSNAINLPTATTIKQGDFLYGIQHRWRQPTSSGLEDLYGIDGSVVMRMKLGYAITDDVLIQVGRTNVNGTYDFEAKHNFLNIRSEAVPLTLAYNLGLTYLSKPSGNIEVNKFQYYGSLIANTMFLDDMLGVGTVATFMNNANPFWFENITTTNIGYYVQFYFNEMVSVNAEGSHVVNGWSEGYSTYSGSVELETGGHFFKFIVSNNTNIHLAGIFANAGAPLSIDANRNALDNVHLGFQISRNL
ncbi:MAG: hypothetical protein Kapaf2KO_02840 [Candidatus Kapaibacteriales bacterium]